MKKKKIIKNYIHKRDGESCYYCKKSLPVGKVTLDHYYPRSLGGPFDVFNLVTSCKRCNSFKKSSIPDDWMAVNLELLRRGYDDGYIYPIGGLGVDKAQIKKAVYSAESYVVVDGYSVFTQKTGCIKIKENKIFEIQKKLLTLTLRHRLLLS